MSKLYALISDTHAANFSTFATILPNGVNSRLQYTLDEIDYAVKELKEAGGNVLVCAGDWFHTRGSLCPTVFNPMLDLFERIVADGIRVVGISGNHDLSSNDSNKLCSAAEALTKVGVEIVSDPAGLTLSEQRLVLIPWHSTLDTLREVAKDKADSEFDLIMHAPINGVLKGLPDAGLESDEVAGWGYKRVFAGHYHNHVDFGNSVYSIGATTHQNWNDPGTKAGHLLVYPDEVTWRCSSAPQFVDVTLDTDPDDIPFIVDGHFVRAKLEIEDESEIADLRARLTEYGAKGVVIHPIRKAATTRSEAVSTGKTLRASVAGFIDERKYDQADEVKALCDDILTTVESADAE